MLNSNTPKTINLLVLFACILLVLLLPFKKEVWYDETISMMCSKGVNSNAPVDIPDSVIFSSAQLQQLNTLPNVFTATVVDNSNSFLYNVCLHWFTLAFGNSLHTYVLLSLIFGVLTLLVVYLLSVSLLGNNLFVSLVVVLLYTDVDFLGMSHEIRAYIMGMMLSALAGLSFFRYINGSTKPINLFLTALLSVAAILTHFLSVYIVLVFVFSLLVIYKKEFFTLRNIVALVLPVLLIAIFFYFSISGIQVMNTQNAKIKAKFISEGFSYIKVLMGTLKFLSLNFKLTFPAFINKNAVIIVSALSVLLLYVAAVRYATSNVVKRNLHLLFLLGSSSSLFLAMLCIKSGHYTALYYRYHSFSVPFSILFVAYALWVLWNRYKSYHFRLAGIIAVFLLPSIGYYFIAVRTHKAKLSYNHINVAAEIVKNNVTEIEVPLWEDAYLIHSVLPANYKVDYVQNKLSTYFTLQSARGSIKIQKLAKNN
jgi:hypothetical protein